MLLNLARGAALTVSAVCVLALPLEARAEPPGAPSSDTAPQEAPPTAPASPDPATSRPRTRADELFDRGRELLRAGRVAEACTVLEQSQRLDPAGGTLLNLSRCYEGLGRFATADAILTRALEAATKRGRQDVITFVRSEQARLAPRIDRVHIALPALPFDAIVRLDARVLEGPERARPVPLDPGAHEVVVTATGHVPSRSPFQIEPSPDAGGRLIEVRIAPLALDAPPPPSRGASDSGDAMRTTGQVSLVTGGLALAAGTVLGIAALLEWSDAESRCPERECDDADARSSASTAETLAGASTGLFVGGLTFAGVGVTLVLAAPPAAVEGEARREARLVFRGALP